MIFSKWGMESRCCSRMANEKPPIIGSRKRNLSQLFAVNIVRRGRQHEKEARERQDDLYDSSELAGIKPGKYYIGIVVHQDGRYISNRRRDANMPDGFAFSS